MNLNIIAGAAATALVLSTGLAFAQTQGAATAQFGEVAFTKAAFVGSGGNPGYLIHKNELQDVPGYGSGPNG